MMVNTDVVKEKSQFKLSFNFKHGKVRVFKKVILALGTPKYIQFLIKPKDKLLFIVGLDHREHDSFPVVLSENTRRGGMVLHGQRFVRKMSEIGGWSPADAHVIGGTFIEEGGMIEFDLTNVISDSC